MTARFLSRAFRRCGVPNASCRGSGAQPLYSHFRPMPRLCIRRGEESSVPFLQQQLKVTLQGDAFARAQSGYAPLNLGSCCFFELTYPCQRNGSSRISLLLFVYRRCYDGREDFAGSDGDCGALQWVSSTPTALHPQWNHKGIEHRVS